VEEWLGDAVVTPSSVDVEVGVPPRPCTSLTTVDTPLKTGLLSTEADFFGLATLRRGSGGVPTMERGSDDRGVEMGLRASSVDERRE
jgi:hypothetical protein